MLAAVDPTMILEGIVTTISAEGELNVAPMGPIVGEKMERFVLRPYQTAQTYRNLKARGEGVFHVTDDVLLLARSAIGALALPPPHFPAVQVRGHVLANACRYYEFLVRELDDREERTRIEVEVVHSGRLREFFGFNRAKHAVLEAAILATRSDFLPIDEIEAEYRKLAVVVAKTGGEAEQEAFEILREHVARVDDSRRGERPR
jgi:hypothetical protein